MKRGLVLAHAVFAFFCLAQWPARARVEAIVCDKSGMTWAGADASDRRKYAPSREIDILHLTLDVTPDFKERTVAATATLRFKPIAQPVAELKLDAIDLEVSSVTSSKRIEAWQATDSNIIVTFAEPVPADKEATVSITYRARPKKGLYFRTAEMGYKAEDSHLWTQGEMIEARHWIPSFDAPNEKFTSEITCRVPEGMVVLANGRKVAEEKDPATGLVVVRWLQDKPHANYLIALCAGYFKKVEDTYRDLSLALWVPASQIDQAATSFRDTKDAMAYFEEEIGVPYPWAKYHQVCVEDFGWGGMENTTLTVLNDRTLFTEASENVRTSQGLIAHELAHQWFGDLVTCKDWSHVWLNEGFATYYETLYDGHKNGKEMLAYRMYESAKGIVEQPNQTNAIVRRNFADPEEQFGYLAYPKGAWILHMLRRQLGEDLYRRCVKAHLERHAYDNVVTEDLIRVIEELSGRSWDQFFDQYVFHASQPELAITYSWDEKTKLAKLLIAQNQKLSDDVLLFRVPLMVRFKGSNGFTDRTLIIKEKSEAFYFSLPAAPQIVRIDPEVSLLAKINFTPPTPLLDAQLADGSDMMGRLLAVEQIGEKKDPRSIEKLKSTLNHDSFYGVRLAAAQALRAIHTDEALDALIASLNQTNALVRYRVVEDIGGFFREKSLAPLQGVLASEKNPEIKAQAIESLGAYSTPEVKQKLIELLHSDSYHAVIEHSAIGAMRAQDDSMFLDSLRSTLKAKESQWPTSVMARGLETLAFLARNEDKKDVVREYLETFLNHPRERLRRASIADLGTLGDTKAIGALEKFSTATKESPERTAAVKAIADLRANRKPGVELSGLRTEVMTLQKENRDLRKELDDLKKRFDLFFNKLERKAPTSKTTKK